MGQATKQHTQRRADNCSPSRLAPNSNTIMCISITALLGRYDGVRRGAVLENDGLKLPCADTALNLQEVANVLAGICPDFVAYAKAVFTICTYIIYSI